MYHTLITHTRNGIAFRLMGEHTTKTHRIATVRGALLLGALVFLGSGCVRQSSTAPTPPPEGGIYRSDDGGVTLFQKVTVAGSGTLATIHPSQVELVRATPEVLYLVATEGLFRTTNAGEQWEYLQIPAASVHSITVHPRNPNILLATGLAPAPSGRGKIWKSLDGGTEWVEVFTAPATRVETGTIVRRQRDVYATINAIAHDPTAGEIIYAGTSTGGLLISLDGGIHWQERHSFKQGVTGLKVSPTKTGLLLIRLADGALVRSTDGGETIELVNLARASDQQGSGLAPVGGFGGGARDPVNAVFFTTEPGGQESILVGTQSTLYRSDDDGVSWVQLRIPSSGTVRTPVNSIAQSSNGTLWAASGVVVFSSLDNGLTWRALDTPLNAAVRFIVADPSRAKRLYFVFAGR